MRFWPHGLAIVGYFALMAAAAPANAASFACSKAATPREKTICADPELSRADSDLAAAYRTALARAAGDWPAYLRADQRRWLRDQAGTCRAEAACLKRDYGLRIAYLRNPALVHSGRYVQGRCPDDGFYLDAVPTRDGTLDVEIYVCPDPSGNMILQASGRPDAAGVLIARDGAACTHELAFAGDAVALKAMKGAVCGSVYRANGLFRRDPAKSPYEAE